MTGEDFLVSFITKLKHLTFLDWRMETRDVTAWKLSLQQPSDTEEERRCPETFYTELSEDESTDGWNQNSELVPLTESCLCNEPCSHQRAQTISEHDTTSVCLHVFTPSDTRCLSVYEDALCLCPSLFFCRLYLCLFFYRLYPSLFFCPDQTLFFSHTLCLSLSSCRPPSQDSSSCLPLSPCLSPPSSSLPPPGVSRCPSLSVRSVVLPVAPPSGCTCRSRRPLSPLWLWRQEEEDEEVRKRRSAAPGSLALSLSLSLPSSSPSSLSSFSSSLSCLRQKEARGEMKTVTNKDKVH